MPINGIGLGNQVRIITSVEVVGRPTEEADHVGIIWDYMAKRFLIWMDNRHSLYRAFTSVKLISKAQSPCNE